MDEQQKNGPGNKNEDIEKNKAMAIVAYIIFLIPLLAAKESSFAKYHTNQGLVLFLTAIIINVLGYIIPVIGWMLIKPLGSLAVLILAVIGIVNASRGEYKPLPFIGSISILK